MIRKPTIFDDDFDKADYIGEVRKRPVPVQPPAEPTKEDPVPNGLERTETGRIVNRRMELLGKALDQQRTLGGNPARDAARRVLARFGRGEF